jgi:hypothetical protein
MMTKKFKLKNQKKIKNQSKMMIMMTMSKKMITRFK